jgi:hypothetical protein
VADSGTDNRNSVIEVHRVIGIAEVPEFPKLW